LKLPVFHCRTLLASLASFMLLVLLCGFGVRQLAAALPAESTTAAAARPPLVEARRQQAAALQSSIWAAMPADGQEGSPQGEKGGEAKGESPHALLYKIINFLILAGALGYLLRKPLADFFRQRAQTITESLQQGRHAFAAAQDRLSAIEAKLAHLDAEIRAFKDSAAHEMGTELQRLSQAAREESERTLAFARMQMEVATRAAALELRRYTALEAVGLAESIIRQRLDDQGRRRLVSRFVEGLAGSREGVTSG